MRWRWTIDKDAGRQQAMHLLDLEITTVRSALNFLHVVGKVRVLQAQVDSALHTLVALGQLLRRQALREKTCENGRSQRREKMEQ